MNRALNSCAACAAILFAVQASAQVADAQPRTTLAPQASPTLSHGSERPPAGLVPIFSNIDYDHPKARYGWDWGYTMEGDAIGRLWLAVPFTPKRDTVIHEVDLAMTHAYGARGFVLGISTDEGGLPGTELAHHEVRKMPELGDCCRLVRVFDDTGLPVLGKKTYWITVTTNGHQSGASLAWNYNVVDETPMAGAWDLGQGWIPTEEFGPAPAFAVWGQ